MLLLLALCILLTSVNALFQAHTPLGLIECQISELSWEGAVGQVQVLVFPGGIESGSPLENLPAVASGIDSVAWLVDQPAGVEYTFVMVDFTTGQVASTAPSLVSANPSGDTSCEGKNSNVQPITGTLGSSLGGSVQSQRPAVTSSDPGVITETLISTTTTTTSSIPDPGVSSATSLHGSTTTMTSIHTPGASTATGNILPLKHTSIAGPVAGTVVGLIVVATAISVLLCIRRRRRDRSLPRTLEDVAPMVGMMTTSTAPSPLPTRTTSNTQIMSSQYTAKTQQQQPHPREPIRSPATSTSKRQLVVMSAADDESLAPTSQQLATLGEENAMLRAVIARMQTSLPPPTDSETLPSYDSRSTYSS
ncbi:hypothetical protein EXIGLDRAFT_832523 [Exidia glandulosa HHB12029]|uniref:Mid2 domain-containing protein n=1 Tax=Exidia glandulosa HHB12029 TaxID=1314781 RepID=A0A165LIY2_EXIGL|nr:hypothetical protein EXIGLDRAFT_832523 [Exidia glandulosa HHB12029]